VTTQTRKHSADNRPIGVFDSGLGGLTVVDAINRLLPEEDLIYLGDTARVPYGDKSVESIREFVRQDVNFLQKRGVKVVVFACNTASAVALESMRKRFPDAHLLGVIDAGVRAALAAGVTRLTVIGTRATVNSDSYRRSIHAVDPSLVVESLPCPLLVPLAEEGLVDSPIARMVIDRYLAKVRANPPEALLLGCTHYPLFQAELDAYFEGKVKIIDSATACALYLRDYLAEHHLQAVPGKSAQSRFFVTDLPTEFHAQAARFLHRIPERVAKIDLENE